MADSPISEELTTLKKRARRRLVGAVALVLIALIVLWTVMDDKPPQSLASQPVAIVSSSPALVSTVTPAAPPAAAPVAVPSLPITKPEVAPVVSNAKPTEPAAAMPSPAADTKPVLAQPKPVAVAEPKPIEKKPETKAVKKDPAKILAGMDDEPAKPAVKLAEANPRIATTEKAEGKFFLQLGAFADKDKAHGLVSKAHEAGVVVSTETVKTDKGSLTRLRAGPYPSHEAAEKAHGKLASAGVSSSIVGK